MTQYIVWGLIIGFIYLVLTESSKPSKSKQHRHVDYSKLDIQSLHYWQAEDKANMDYEVVGESFYQDNIAAISNLTNLLAYLIPEDNNPYDTKAIRVDIEQKTVGYLAKDDARSFRRKLRNKKVHNDITYCKASVTGGYVHKGKQLSYGIELDFYK